MNDIEKELLKLSNKALKHGDVPVSAIIIYKGKIVGKGYNTREKNNDVMGHAEINAIKRASKKMKTWNLSDTDMYISLEPCDMCKEIINQSRIKNVYYFLGNNKKVESKTKYHKIDSECCEKMEKELKIFFKKMR